MIRDETGALSSDAGSLPVSTRDRLGLGLLGLTAFMTSVDLFVLLLALPEISRSLNADAGEQLWIADVYGFSLVGLMLAAGALADRIGRRRLLFAGGIMFAAASVLAAFAPSTEVLIAARALLGAAGATLAPCSLGLIAEMFPDDRLRTRAISVWHVCFTVGAVVGPIAGGLLVEHFWWGAVFLLGVPPMLLLLVIGPWTLPNSVPRKTAGSNVDLTSVVLCLITIFSTVAAIKQFASNGIDGLGVSLLAVGLGAGVAFCRRQTRIDNPLLDVSLFASRRFVALTSMMVLLTTLSALMFVTSQFLQVIGGLTPVQVAYALLPATFTSVIGTALMPLLVRIARPLVVVAVGMSAAAGGAVLIAHADLDRVASVIVGLALVTLGTSPIVALGTKLVLDAVPPSRSSSGGAIAETATELGYALGVAALGSIATIVYRLALDRSDVSARDAYLAGVHASAWTAAGVAVLIVVVAAGSIASIPRQGERLAAK